MKLSDWLFLLLTTAVVLGTLGGYKLLTSKSSLQPYEKYFVKQEALKQESINQEPIKEQTSQKIKATFLGTSSVLISDGQTTLLTDGFISRPGLSKLLLSKIEPNKEKIKSVLTKLNVEKIDAIMTLHSHHDHALDSAFIAQTTQAVLIGSPSSANIARGSGLNETKIKVVKHKKSFKFGQFRVTMIPFKHTVMPSFLRYLVGMGESIEKPLMLPSYFVNFKEGGTYSLYIEHPLGNIFINGSSGFVNNQLEGYNADVVFLGIARLGKNSILFQEEYFNEVVKKLKAKRVIPIHWDDFTKDIDKPMIPMNRLFDDFAKSMDFLIKQTEQNSIKLELLNIFDEIVLYEQKSG